MHKASQRIKSERIKDLLKEGKSLSNIDIPSLNRSFPEGFLLDDGYEDIVSLFYIGKRIATFNATKITVERVNNKIERFRKNKHKYNK